MDENGLTTELIDETLDSEPVTETEKPASLEDTVRAAVEGHKEGKTEEEILEKPVRASKKPVDPKLAREVIFGKKEAKKPVKEAKAEVEPDAPEEILPPQPLNPQQKELFHTLPPEMKKGVADMVNGLQSHATKLFQETKRAQAQSEGIVKAIQPYVPSWNLKGVHEIPSAIAQICAGQHVLDTQREDGFVKLANIMQIDKKLLAQKLLGLQETSTQNNSVAPQNDALTKRLIALESVIAQQRDQASQAQSQQAQQQARQAAQEVEQLRNQRGSDGKFLYSKLHETGFLQQIQQLVGSLREINPSESWAESYRKAHDIATGNPSASSAPRLASNSTNQIEKAKAASVSLRGRGAAPAAPVQVPKGQKLEDTVRLAWEMNQRSNGVNG